MSKTKALFFILKRLLYKLASAWFGLKFQFLKQELLAFYVKLFKLRQINERCIVNKLKHYLRRWHRTRKDNPWVSTILTNMIQNTPIIGQIALWRMKINQGIRPRKMNAIKLVAAILMKRVFQKIINDHQAVFIYNLSFQLPNFDNFDSGSLVTTGKEDDYVSLISAVKSQQNEKKAFDPKSIVFQMMSRFFKKKTFKDLHFAFNKIKELQPVQVQQKRQSKSEQQSQIIKFLLEQNMMTKRDMEQKSEVIRKQVEELLERSRQLHFVKDHY